MQKGNAKISMAVIRRLPKYRRYLAELLDRGVHRISSRELSKIIGFTASQIRQDLNNFGGFGQQGYGYNVAALYEAIGKILGLDRKYNTIIVGAGNLGQAIANYTNFEKSGFIPKAMFDINPKLIGLKIRDIEIIDADKMEEYIKENNVDIGIICTNKEQAQAVADRLVKSNIKGIWNFAPTDLDVPEKVMLENVHLSESLYTLSFLLKHNRID
ncbi:redox-sensing transcriptional repressor Rex [Crassaminicella thermophila]|uniref:Redox-sensing transcriptional repressor Rex n=1 Tax=Crassaminicella thermophila TaxID=2599308 RepID=A0A5C0SJI6_CRATE|nr:redox-sensing transcriptional repressor Rex [Crassaminicella thermophila]QEK13109.1 redox-sensing transcriptional repressor Rex [Crassaminicella thermophila]